MSRTPATRCKSFYGKKSAKMVLKEKLFGNYRRKPVSTTRTGAECVSSAPKISLSLLLPAVIVVGVKVGFYRKTITILMSVNTI